MQARAEAELAVARALSGLVSSTGASSDGAPVEGTFHSDGEASVWTVGFFRGNFWPRFQVRLTPDLDGWFLGFKWELDIPPGDEEGPYVALDVATVEAYVGPCLFEQEPAVWLRAIAPRIAEPLEDAVIPIGGEAALRVQKLGAIRRLTLTLDGGGDLVGWSFTKELPIAEVGAAFAPAFAVPDGVGTAKATGVVS